MNRHGDEVSVGTMNLQNKTTFISEPLDMFAIDEEDQVENKRPWENALAMDAAEKPLVIDELDVAEAATAALAETQPETGFMNIETSNHSHESEKSELSLQLDTPADEEKPPEDELPDNEKEDEEPELAEEQLDEFTSLVSFRDLETFLEDKEEEKEVNFDEMWDTVSCDDSTALEFEVKKREKERAKDKKRTQWKKAKAEKQAKATPRLRLFEKEKEMAAKRQRPRYRKQKPESRLSNEFLTAIHRVFDEDILDVDSGSDAEESLKEKPQLMRLGSEKSLYLTSDVSVSKASKVHDRENGSKADEDSNDELGVSRASRGSRASTSSRSRRAPPRRHSSKSSKKGRRSSRSSKRPSRSRQPDVDPAAIFEKELKRQQGAKLLSVSSLRQEMTDRRGTSVILLEKEFAERKKVKQDEDVLEDNEMDFNGANDGGAGKYGYGADNYYSSRAGMPDTYSSLLRQEDELDKDGAVPTGFDNHVSRWDTSESISDLDDLRTIAPGTEDAAPANNPMEMVSNALSSIPSNSPAISELPAVSTVRNNMASMPMPNMPSLSNIPAQQSAPASPKKASGKLKAGPPSPGGFNFAAGFDDMPLTTITENPGKWDDENDNGLLSSGFGDDNRGFGGKMNEGPPPRSNSAGGRLGFSLSGVSKNLESVGGAMKMFKAKMPKRSQSSGARLDGFDGYNDGGGLLG